VVDVCLDSHELILSEHILAEVDRHLRETLHHQRIAADERVRFLREAATIVDPVALDLDACRDADDLPVLGTMLAGSADCLVTGDKDLLELGKFNERPILTPRQFWQSLSK
jgi:putative PIN family toxin of toxin-antitoxin system